MKRFMMLSLHGPVLPDDQNAVCKIQGIVGGTAEDFRVGDLVKISKGAFVEASECGMQGVFKVELPEDGDWADLLERVEG